MQPKTGFLPVFSSISLPISSGLLAANWIKFGLSMKQIHKKTLKAQRLNLYIKIYC